MKVSTAMIGRQKRTQTTGRAYKRYVLSILTIVLSYNYIDRTLLILLLQPIKHDLRLSDTQLGLLTGIAFGLFYASLGIAISRRADKGNRVNITSVAMGLWAITVMSFLLVTNFVQIIAARIAAAVGEAGCGPPTYSLVGDYFPEPAERSRAMSVYYLAGAISAIISFPLSGWLNDHYGWRLTFFIMGVPAIFLAAVVKFSVREPRAVPGVVVPAARSLPSMSKVLRLLWDGRSLRYLTLAIVSFWTVGSGLLPWYAAFLIRSHGMSVSEVGLWIGVTAGLGGGTGALLGGYIAANHLEGDERGQLRLSAGVILLLLPLYAAFLLLSNKYLALLAFVPTLVAFNFFLGPIFAITQRLVRSDSRATIYAVIMFLANIIGAGVGPLVVGTLSDAFAAKFGSDSLRYAMLAMSAAFSVSSYFLWKAGRSIKGDLVEVERFCVVGMRSTVSEKAIP
jgi:MFS family permease